MAVERTVVAVFAQPHAHARLERVLEQLVPLGERGERHAEPFALLLVVAAPDPEPRPAAREDVQRGHRLGQHARVPEVRAGGQRHEPDGRRVRGEETERGVRLEARALGAAHDRVLPQVVTDRDAVEATGLGQLAHVAEEAGHLVGLDRPAEIGEMHHELHDVSTRSGAATFVGSRSSRLRATSG